MPPTPDPDVDRFTAGDYSVGVLCAIDDAPLEPAPAQPAAAREEANRAIAPSETRRLDPAAAPLGSPQPPASSARRTVLVVDDESLVRLFVQQLLRRRGLTTLAAVDGNDALARYRENATTVGLVVTDIHMPAMDGLELIRALQREPNPPALAVMSGRLDASMRAALSREGVRCVLAKPFPLEEIDSLIALVPA